MKSEPHMWRYSADKYYGRYPVPHFWKDSFWCELCDREGNVGERDRSVLGRVAQRGRQEGLGLMGVKKKTEEPCCVI